jgi:hypothetical protein
VARDDDDPRAGIVLPDARLTARKVRIRRLKRRLKAAVSVAIALAAGTYIACKGDDAARRPAVPPNPTTDEVSNLPAPRDAGADGATDASVDASGDASGDAASADATALVRRDAGAKDGGVDRTEHRKGMPVPDNLLE